MNTDKQAIINEVGKTLLEKNTLEDTTHPMHLGVIFKTEMITYINFGTVEFYPPFSKQLYPKLWSDPRPPMALIRSWHIF